VHGWNKSGVTVVRWPGKNSGAIVFACPFFGYFLWANKERDIKKTKKRKISHTVGKPPFYPSVPKIQTKRSPPGNYLD